MAAGDKVIFLTSGTSFTRPTDYNNAANTWEAIGAGGDSTVALGGRTGGCYAKISNFTCPASLTYQIGVHGGSTGSGTAPTSNTWIKDSSTLVAPGIDSTTTNCVGSTVFAGGAGGGVGNGGGGAGGPNAAGNANSGTTGGKGDGTFGGAGGTPGNPGNPGAAGAEWTSNPGGSTAGSGGGGGANNVAGAGGAGGLYGGGAGGDVSSGAANGGGGIIVITYTPIIASWNTPDTTAPRRRKFLSLDNDAPNPVPLLGPGNVGGLILWFDAADTSTITSAAGAISQWLDKSSSGKIASQATGSAKPTLILKGQNGLNTVRFTAANFQTLTFNSLTADVGTTYTLIQVFKRSAAATWGHALGSTTVATLNGYTNTDNLNLQDSTTSFYTISTVPENGLYNLFSMQLAAGASGLQFNGVYLSTGSYGNSYGTTTFNNLGITGGSIYSDATVAEVLLYNRVISVPELAAVNAYMQAKWDTGRPPNSWQTPDDTAPGKRKFRQLDETAYGLIPPPGVVANFGWNSADNAAQPRKKYRQLDEAAIAPSSTGLPPPLFFGWNSNDTERPAKRKFSSLDETSQASSPFGLPAPPYGWETMDVTRPARRKYLSLDNTPEVPSLRGLPAPPYGWNTWDNTAPRKKTFRPLDEAVGVLTLAGLPAPKFGWAMFNDTPSLKRKYRQLDETAQPWKSVAGGPLGAHDLTDTPGMPLTDTAGVHLTDVFDVTPAPPYGWNTWDITAPWRRKYRQLDETVQAPSSTGLPPPTPLFGWNTNDTQGIVRRKVRGLDETTYAPSSAWSLPPPYGWASADDTSARRRRLLGLDEATSPIFLPPIVPPPSTMWMTADYTAPRRKKFISLDETIQPLFPPPFIVTTPSSFWMTDDDTAPRKRRFVSLDEAVQPIFQTADFSSFGMWFIGADAANDWNVAQTAQFSRRRFHQLDELVQAPSPFGLPPPQLFLGWDATDIATLRRRFGRLDEIAGVPLPAIAASFGWNAADNFRTIRRTIRPLDGITQVFGLLPPPPPLFFGWASADEPRQRRYKFVSLDETVIPLRLPPGLPAIIPPPTGPLAVTGRSAVQTGFVFGPNTPQLGDLAMAVLQDLGVLESGQPVASEDANTIILRLFPKLEELNERDVAHIDADNISNAQFLPLVKIMANECASAFTIVDPTKLQTLAQKGGMGGEAEQTLKDIVRLRTPRQTMRVELFSRNPYGRRYW